MTVTHERIKQGRPPRADQARLTREIRLKAAVGGGTLYAETPPGEGPSEARRFRSSKYLKALRRDGIRAAVYNIEGGEGYIIEVSPPAPEEGSDREGGEL